MGSKEEVKIIIAREGLTVEKLAHLLSEKTGRYYTQQSLQHKISLSSLNYDEMEDIAKILNYKIYIEKIQN
ncbi:hypothetical protein IJ843_04445 [bacterium]|nr:hypothetical protein [bacterium]